MFPIVERTVAVRREIVKQIDLVEGGGSKLGGTIQGTYQDEAMLAVVRPHVVGELRARLFALDRDLRNYNITINIITTGKE